MHVIRRRGWEIPERLATPEHLFWNRRALLAGSGAAALSLAPNFALAQRISDLPDPTKDLYPVGRNEKYALDRPVTDEKINTNYNNFYEFGSSKSVAKAAQALKLRPWTVKIDGMVETPQEIGIDDLIRKMPLEERLYRHRCVEAWSMAIAWSGFSVCQAGGIGQAFVRGKIRADGDLPRSFRRGGPEAELVALALYRGTDHRRGDQ
jgi:methionine sulfoxide reductase catalytic subunit